VQVIGLISRKMKVFKCLYITINSILFFICAVNVIYAQVTSSGIATTVDVKGEQVDAGDIICKKDDGFAECDSEYNTEIYGVIVDNPAASFEEEDQAGRYLVMSNGKAPVRVSSLSGDINKGDLVTTSSKAGIGVLAQKNGYVLGQALEEYKSDNIDNIGTIMIAINIHPAAGLSGARSNLITALREGMSAPIFEPLDSLRYLLAALILLLSFVLGFAYFGRVSKSGIEAIGRNPLASKMIQLSVIMHIMITIVIILVGFAMAYIILIF